MEIKYDRYKMISPYECTIIIKYIDGYPQYYTEDGVALDMNFVPTATLGIIAREYEQQQFIGLLQTLGAETPVLPILLKGIIGNSSLSNRMELIAKLDEMMQPNPEAQQMQQMQQQLAMQAAQANIAVQTTQAEQNRAEAQKLSVEAQLTLFLLCTAMRTWAAHSLMPF